MSSPGRFRVAPLWGAQVTDYRVAPLERSGRGTYTGQRRGAQRSIPVGRTADRDEAPTAGYEVA